MKVSIVIRTADPAAAAEFARALGLSMKAPNRPNPTHWHCRDRISIVIMDAGDGPAGITIGPLDFPGAITGIGELAGETALEIVGEGTRFAVVAGPTGHIVTLERDAPRAEPHHSNDVGKTCWIMPVFKKNRGLILDALSERGLSNPRLAGPSLGRVRRQDLWTLVVDGDDGADTVPMDELLAELSKGFDKVRVVLSHTLKPDHLAQIEREGYDI